MWNELRKKDGLKLVVFAFLFTLSIRDLFSQSFYTWSSGFVPNPYGLSGHSEPWVWSKESIYDTSWLTIYYEMTFWNCTRDEKETDYRVIYLGQGGSRKECSWRIERYEQLLQADSLEHHGRIGAFFPQEWRIDSTGKSVCLFRFTSAFGSPMVLKYPEEAAEFEWNLLPELDSVCGYLCQKAKTEYKGRKYEAWYSPDLPIDAGPYKFRGLPGLILKVQDLAGDYAWELYDGRIESDTAPMVEKKYLGHEASRAKSRKLVQKMMASPVSYMLSNGHRIHVYEESTGSVRPLTEEEKQVSVFYTPIEME